MFSPVLAWFNRYVWQFGKGRAGIGILLLTTVLDQYSRAETIWKWAVSVTTPLAHTLIASGWFHLFLIAVGLVLIWRSTVKGAGQEPRKSLEQRLDDTVTQHAMIVKDVAELTSSVVSHTGLFESVNDSLHTIFKALASDGEYILKLTTGQYATSGKVDLIQLRLDKIETAFRDLPRSTYGLIEVSRLHSDVSKFLTDWKAEDYSRTRLIAAEDHIKTCAAVLSKNGINAGLTASGLQTYINDCKEIGSSRIEPDLASGEFIQMLGHEIGTQAAKLTGRVSVMDIKS